MFERHGLLFAPILRPRALFDDPRLNAGGLALVRMNDGSTSKVALLPLTVAGERLGIRQQPPLRGEHGTELLREAAATRRRTSRRSKRRACWRATAPDLLLKT